MHHLAILRKEGQFLERIRSKEKTIESRWYKHKKTPYNNISVNDTVFFKESGKKVSAKATVDKVLFFDNLNLKKIKEILKEYGKDICLPLSYAKELEGKNYCTLIFLKDVKDISHFDINKKGYGNMAAWITVENINKIKK